MPPLPTDTATDSLTVTLTNKADVAWIRARVRDGDFASPSDFVAEGVTRLREDEEEREHWLRTEGAASYQAYLAEPNDVYTIEEVWQHLEQTRRERAERTVQPQ